MPMPGVPRSSRFLRGAGVSRPKGTGCHVVLLSKYLGRVFLGIPRGFVVGPVIYHSNLFAARHRNTVESRRAFSDGDRDSMNQEL